MAQAELQKLRLRFEHRPQPYHMIIKEHFPDGTLQKFVDPEHQCLCNICGKDMESLVKEQV